MKIIVKLMRDKGVARRPAELRDVFCPQYHGDLSLRETTNQGLNRLSLVALLDHFPGHTPFQLFDARIVWIEGNRMMLTGLEYVNTDRGQVAYSQSWLCQLNVSEPHQAAEKPGEHRLNHTV